MKIRRQMIKKAKQGHRLYLDDLKMKWQEFRGKCWICRCRSAKSWDHVIPLARGGEHSIENLRPACEWCNSRMGAATAKSLAGMQQAVFLLRMQHVCDMNCRMVTEMPQTVV